MNKKLELMYGSLLHDIGKIVYRSNSVDFAKGTHSKIGSQFLNKFKPFQLSGIVDSVSYHHYKELASSSLLDDSVAYITYIADNIASGTDRRASEGDYEGEGNRQRFDKRAPLASIFNVVNSETKGLANYTYSFEKEQVFRYPTDAKKEYTSSQYAALVNKMTDDLSNKLKVGPDSFSSLLQWTESLWSYIPSSTDTNQVMDVSLYDHSKITCAIASCIYDYLTEMNCVNYRKELFSPYEKTKQFYQEDVFLLVSLDMSGIQDFIYNISGSKALKSLRSRSFYLEIMLESLVDDLLSDLELSRANLLYTGGGHAYLLLPNTERARDVLASFEGEMKEWFIKIFKTDLSVAIAYKACTGEDLMNSNGTYSDLWQTVSRKLSDKKAHKYSLNEIKLFNSTIHAGTRECKECLRSDIDISEDSLCKICEGIIAISNDLRDYSFFVVSPEGKVPLPRNRYLSVENQDGAERKIKMNKETRIYSKNQPFVGKQLVTNLWMCDYDFSTLNPETKKQGIASYVNREVGIPRLGVLRADIDNLGTTFIKGIPEQYRSISRTATLSRQLSMFFKFELSNILKGARISVIYSGGDDLFLIGAWDDVISKALVLRKAFTRFSAGKLTFSAGIGMYPVKYPISKMASETGVLEDLAKRGEKNQVALWNDSKVFGWSQLEEQILKEKMIPLQEALTNSQEHGKSFLYKMLELLRNEDQINIARLAYLLARSSLSEELTQSIFAWSQNKQQKVELITAIEYLVYQIREAD